MSWARLDDGFYDHPKVIAAGFEAAGFFCMTLAYCSRHSTDGALSQPVLERLALGRTDLVATLVEVGLFDAAESGVRIHDFLTYNPSAREVAKRRKGQRIRTSKHRTRNGVCNALQPEASNALLRDGTGRVSSSASSPASEKKRRAPASTFPDDFALTADMAAKLVAKGCKSPALAFQQFRNHHIAKGSRMASWPHAFVTWVGNHGVYGCEGCGPKVRVVVGKQSAREMAQDIAAEWAAEEVG